MGYSYNPRSEKEDTGGLSLRPTWLDVKIIMGSIWEERDNGERYRGGEGRAEEEKRHKNTQG